MQFCKVDLDGRAYTYSYPDAVTLAPGDWVWVPSNVLVPHPQRAQVIRLLDRSDYPGKVTEILRKASV